MVQWSDSLSSEVFAQLDRYWTEAASRRSLDETFDYLVEATLLHVLRGASESFAKAHFRRVFKHLEDQPSLYEAIPLLMYWAFRKLKNDPSATEHRLSLAQLLCERRHYWHRFGDLRDCLTANDLPREAADLARAFKVGETSTP